MSERMDRRRNPREGKGRCAVVGIGLPMILASVVGAIGVAAVRSPLLAEEPIAASEATAGSTQASASPSNAVSMPISIPVSIPIPIPAAAGGKPLGTARCIVERGPFAPVTAIAFAPDGKALASGGYREALLWDLAETRLARRVGTADVRGAVGALAFLPDGRLALGEGTPGGPGAVRIYDVSTGAELRRFEEPSDAVYALAPSPDGKLLVAGGADGLARVFGLEDGKLLGELRGHAGWVLGATFSADGKLLATASADQTARLWDTGTWESTLELREADAVVGVAFGADPRLLALAVGGADGRSIQMRRTDNVRSRKALTTGGGAPLDVLWTGKAARLYVPSTDGVVRILDANGKPVATLAGHEDWVYRVALSPDEKRIASGSADGTVRLWSAAGRPVATLIQLAPRSDEWLILTAEGSFVASSGASLRFEVDGAGGAAASAASAAAPAPPAEQWREALRSAERVKELLERADPPPAAGRGDQRRGNERRGQGRGNQGRAGGKAAGGGAGAKDRNAGTASPPAKPKETTS